jgi:hypothetical protein
MSIRPWADYVEMLLPAGALNALSWFPDDDQVRAELYRQLIMNVSLGYILHFQADPDHPDWAPYLNSLFMLQPNPDDCYLSASIDGSGAYRITGDRGTVKLLTLDVGRAFLGVPDQPLPKLASYDLDTVPQGPDGALDILLSAERPAGYDGTWLHLDPRAERLLVRQRSYDWGNEREARLTIERVDRFSLKPRMSENEIAEKLAAMLSIFTPWLTRMFLIHQNEILAQGTINQFDFHGFAAGLGGQVYWESIFQIAPGEALLIETDLPARRRYWNVQLNDPLFNTVEYVHRQSSLNGHQAEIDSDGRFRAVIALKDPGVPNWLDPGEFRQGTVIGRWFECDSHPLPTLTKVLLADLRAHIPGDTPLIDPAERERRLRQRVRSAQLRRRW